MYNVNGAFTELQKRGITDSIQMVRRWLRDGTLQGERSADRKAGWRIHPDELARFITARKPDEKLRCLEAEIERLTAVNKQLEEALSAVGRSPAQGIPLYTDKLVDDLWNMRIEGDFKDVPEEILQEARRAFDRILSHTTTVVQYVCPFTGKRFGRMEKVIRAGIDFVIQSKVSAHKSREERIIRERAGRERYLDQIW